MIFLVTLIFYVPEVEVLASLEYNPFIQEWAVQRSDSDETQLAAKLEAAKI